MFSNYRFKLNDERSVLFRLVSADTARENRKDNDKDRRFIIVTEPKTFTRIDEDGEEFEETIVPFSIQNNKLTILFEYATLPKGSKQETLNIESYNKIVSAEVLTTDWLNDLAQPAPTEKEPKRTVLHKHLSTYTQKNTADYFIHKDLGKFLRHELDFYIKNEVMHLDDVVSTDQFIQIERQLSIIKCLRQIGLEIISFLASLEDFQKKLWLKKKFVVSAKYCITLDRVDESLYTEIAGNTSQWQQWEDLGFKGKEAGWGTVDYLKQHQALMVDTSLFSLEFKAKLLKRIDDLDAQTDGLIINSDNFQALSLLGEKYKQLVGCIYIDPPYNAKSSEILYKNTFKHSAFLTFISNRLEVAKPFLQSGGLLNIAIDDYEQKGVITVCDEIYGSNNFIANVVVQHNPRGRNDDKFYGTSHEYMIVYTNNIENANLGNFTLSDEDKSIYRLSDTISKYQEVSFMRTGNNSDRVTRPNLFYPIYLNKKTNLLSLDKSDDSIEILPINSSKEEKTWRWERKTFLERKDTEVSFKISEDGVRLYKKRRLLDVGKKPKTIWFDSKYDASSSGIMFLRNFFSKDNHEFSYPKSIYTVKDAVYISSSKNGVVLDYFAGSGTTAHATIALNREDHGSRKYILVEQGEYFDTVIKPRIQKVVYSADWKEGKPTNPESGISHCLKVVKLESYEDTLNNLELVRKGAQQTLLAEQQASTKPEDHNAYSDYLMHYMLELESKDSLLNVKDFLKPFSYQMNITTDSAGAFERKTIDLVETFNYLIGMNVQEVDYQLDKGYAQITGKLRTGEYTTVLWRDCDKIGYAELDQLLSKLKINPNDGEYQLIYINGDHNVASKYTTKEGEEKQLKVRSIEQTFLKNMFEE